MIIPKNTVFWLLFHNKCCPPLHQPREHLSNGKTLIQRLIYTLMNVGETFQPKSLNPIRARWFPGHLPNMMFSMFSRGSRCSNSSSIVLTQQVLSLCTTRAPFPTQKLLPLQNQAEFAQHLNLSRINKCSLIYT